MKLKWMLAGLLSAWAMALVIDASVAGQVSSFGYVREQLKFSEWAVETHAPTGFVFSKGDYPALADWPVDSDATSCPGPDWDTAAGGYTTSITRAIKFKNEQQKVVELLITVHPHNKRAIYSLLIPYDLSSGPVGDLYAGDSGMLVGATALIRGIRSTDASETVTADITDFVFVRYNVRVDLKKPADVDLDLVTLARAMDAKIVEQAQTPPAQPHATLSLAKDSVEFTDDIADYASVTVAMEASSLQPGEKRLFFSGSKSSQALGEEGYIVIAEDQIYWGGSLTMFQFDDTGGAPTFKVRATMLGQYKVGMIVWGEALWPRIVTRDFEIKD